MITPEELGFQGSDPWRKTLRGQPALFRTITDLDQMEKIVDLQMEIWGFDARETVPSNVMRVVDKTGGTVLGAYLNGELVGFLFGWGGLYQGRPQIVSHMLGVKPEQQQLGIGFELKALQACCALRNGFQHITWTWDPLRGANARLNFEKLGITVREYVINYYGEMIATGLYANMPTDRVVAQWDIASERVRSRLMGQYRPLTLADLQDVPEIVDGEPLPDSARLTLRIPADIDRLRDENPQNAARERLRIRAALTRCLPGYAMCGFATGWQSGERVNRILLQRE